MVEINPSISKEPLLPMHEEPSTTANVDDGSSVLKSILANKYAQIASGPVACALITLFVHEPGSSRNMLAVLAWVFLWWLTEAVPMAVTSMSPLFLFPMFGISTADHVIQTYMDDVISLVLGSFILALAIEHYNIHKRLALNITSLFCGDPLKPPLLLLGICGTTAFVSMWMHNTAAAVMMIPVATGILQRLPDKSHGSSGVDTDVQKFCKAVILGVTYSAAVGGMSTLTGTGVNLILIGIWQTYFPQEEPISFSTWFMFGFPLAVMLFFALWVILCLMYCSKSTGKSLSSYLDKNHLKRELELLGTNYKLHLIDDYLNIFYYVNHTGMSMYVTGPMDFAEKMILAIFGGLILLWMTRSITDDLPGWGALFHDNVGDGTVSVMMATLLFVIPNKKADGEKLMDWNKCKKLPWNMVLLLGAGFAIADGVRTSGLADELSQALGFLKTAPYIAITPLACLISATITEFTSNNSTTTLVVPLLIELARSMGVHPLLLMVPGAIGAQFAFLLPTGTPSNVVGFATGHVTIKDMIKVGLPLKVAGLALITFLMPTLGAYVFGTNKIV